MTRIPAILILLCLSTLLASCGVGTNSTPGRVVAVEQARAEADAQLALASQALVDAEAAAEAATQAHLAAEAAATRAAEYAVLSRDEGEAASVFAGDSPWLDEWLMTEWVIPLREVQTASCLSMKLSKATETQRMSHRGFQSLCHIRVRTVQLPPTSL